MIFQGFTAWSWDESWQCGTLLSTLPSWKRFSLIMSWLSWLIVMMDCHDCQDFLFRCFGYFHPDSHFFRLKSSTPTPRELVKSSRGEDRFLQMIPLTQSSFFSCRFALDTCGTRRVPRIWLMTKAGFTQVWFGFHSDFIQIQCDLSCTLYPRGPRKIRRRWISLCLWQNQGTDCNCRR